jgi:high-affinity iron transporter
MIEYQDSTAFIAQAEPIFTSIEADMPDEEAEEVAEFFEQLDPLTGSNASFEEVETVIGGIVHEFEEAFGLEEEEESEYDGQAYIDRIVELLDQAVAKYGAGNAQEAKALAIEAYLDNYEFIEADIEEDDPELMEKIELAIREELVKMIDDRRPAAEIEAHVE